MNHGMAYAYNIIITAPNDFAAASFIGSLHEEADQWRRFGTRIDILSISPGNNVGEMPEDSFCDPTDYPDGIDTIPLF